MKKVLKLYKIKSPNCITYIIHLPCFPPAEAVSKLAVSKLMKASTTGHAEVAPHILAWLEVEVLQGAGGWLEPFVGVLGGDTGTDHVTFNINKYLIILHFVNNQKIILKQCNSYFLIRLLFAVGDFSFLLGLEQYIYYKKTFTLSQVNLRF